MTDLEKQIYLCKYHDIDKGLRYTVGMKKTEIENLIKILKEKNIYEKYRNLSEEEYEKMIERKKKK